MVRLQPARWPAGAVGAAAASTRLAVSLTVGLAVALALAIAPARSGAQDTATSAADTSARVRDTARTVTKSDSTTAATALAARRSRPEIKAVVINGAHALTQQRIQRGIVTTVSHCRGALFLPFCLVSRAPYFYQRNYLDHQELARDVLRIRVLYWKSGFRLASVDTAVTPPGGTTARVTFTIHEGPPTLVTDVTVVPDTLLSAHERQRLVRLRPGRRFSHTSLDSTASRIQHLLWNRGYADVTVDTSVVVRDQPPSDSATRAAAAAGLIHAGTASITITINPHGRTFIDTVIVTGNKRISAQTIRHALIMRPHSLFLRGDVQRSQRSLYATSLFRRAAITIDTVPGKPDSLKAVVVSVDEAPPREVEAGAGFTTADFFNVSGRYTDYNWVGGGRRLIIQSAIGNLFAHGLYTAFNNGYKEIPTGVSPDPYLAPTWRVSADVTQPWFLAPENSLTLGGFASRQVAPGVFIDNTYGGNLSLSHDVADRSPLTLAYRYSVTHVEAGDVYFCVDYGVCDEATRDALRSRARLSPLGLTLQVDRTNDPVNPSGGYLLRAGVQYASQFTASDFRYARAYANASLYRPVGRAVLAFNARVGVVGPLGGSGAALGDTSGNILHPTVRFYAGGAQSVRGFAENQLGPRVLTIPPEVLRGRKVVGNDTTYQCALSTPIQNCQVNGVSYLNDADFSPQALGGRTLLEGSVEYRFPIIGNFGGAVFVDGGIVGQGNLHSATSGTGAITPGFGIRYFSLIGPIRIDVGLNPLTTEHLVVLTETAARQIIVVTGPAGTPPNNSLRTYAPARTEGGLQGVLNRVSLHLSVGQAF